MRINTNILSLSAQRNLATTTRALARAMEKLASGSRINSARDDAAGLAISSGLEAQRRAMTQAIRNMNDARGFLNTAEGALAEQTNILQRMRELAMQSANGTLSADDRAYLNQEFEVLTDEFARLTDETTFNGNYLFKGALDNLTLQVGSAKGQTMRLQLDRPQFVIPEATLSETLPSGTFTSTNPSIASGVNGSFETSDLDADGDIDIIGETGVYLNNAGSFTQSQSWTQTANSYFATDLNGDGKRDLIYSYLNTYIQFGNGNGTFQSRITLSTDPDTEMFPGIGDIDNDGDIDVIVNHTEGIRINEVYLNNGSGSFSLSTTFTNSTVNMRPIFADIDEDGDLDIVGGRSTALGALLFFNNGSGVFSPEQTMGGTLGSLDVVDVDSDGNLDVLIRDRAASTVSIQYGNGNGTFLARVTLASGLNNNSGSQIKGIDLDEDGLLDIVAINQDDATASVYKNLGNRQFSAQSLITGIGTNAGTLRVSDMNGDGFQDIVTMSPSGGLRIHLQDSYQTSATEAPEMTVATQSDAEDMLDIIDDTLAQINSMRANIGAYQNRLDYAESNASTMVENISAAKSQVLDTDYASEMAEFTRLQILQEAGLSVLSQANISARLSLKLLQVL